MVCYAVPLAACLLLFAWRKASKRKGAAGLWLGLILFGGAVFGVVDHAWNGELLASENLVFDLILGLAITLASVAAWAVIVTAAGVTARKPASA